MNNMVKKHNNSGFSLVELLIVIAIMGILVGVSAISYNLINRTNVNKSTKLVEEYLTLCREKAKSINAYEWNVTIEENEISIYKITQGEDGLLEESIKSDTLPKSVKIYILDQAGNPTYISSEDMDAALISFKPLSGAVKDIYFYSDGSDIDGPDINTESYCDIVSEYKNDKNKSVRLFYTTGKHTTN